MATDRAPGAAQNAVIPTSDQQEPGMPAITPRHPRTNYIRRQQEDWGCFVCATLAVVEHYARKEIAATEADWFRFYKLHDHDSSGGKTDKALKLAGHHGGSVAIGTNGLTAVNAFTQSVQHELDLDRPVLADVTWHSQSRGKTVGHVLYVYGYEITTGPSGTVSLYVADSRAGVNNDGMPAEPIDQVAISHGGPGAVIKRFHLTTA